MRVKALFAAAALSVLTVYGKGVVLKPGWWKDVVLEPTPTNDLVYAAKVLREQKGTSSLLYIAHYSAPYAVAATNLWRMLAALHGDLREKKVEPLPTVYLGFGIVEDREELERLIEENEKNKRLCVYQSLRGTVERHVREVIERIAASEAVASFPAAERNDMTSNIVALARFDAKEAASLGLTNVVDAAEIDAAEK